MMNATSHHMSEANRWVNGLYSLACVNVFYNEFEHGGCAGPSFYKWQKVGTSCRKLKETEIHEILGTEESDEEYSSDTDYSYERSGSESNNENENESHTECDYDDDDDEQNCDSDKNSYVNRYKSLNISWTI
jgi:hypothetical protein